PDPDLSLGWTVGRSARAMMDLSDGLIRDGRRLAAASQVTLDLDGAALTPDVEHLAALAHELDADPWSWVLHGGEEHAMLGVFAPAPDGPAVLLDGAVVEGTGFDHFA